jgi:PEP-CTERM motif
MGRLAAYSTTSLQQGIDMKNSIKLGLAVALAASLPTAAMALPSRASFAYSGASVAQLFVNGTTTLSAVSQGWISNGGLNNGGGINNYIAGRCGSDDVCFGDNSIYNNYFVFDLEGISAISSAELRLAQPSPNGYISSEAFETYSVWDTDVSAGAMNSASGIAFHNDLMTGVSFASGNVDASTIGTITSFTFNAAGLNALNANAGGLYGFGGTLSVAGAPGVPEPASWAMLIAGFGLTGAVMRRRRTLATA